MTQEPYRGFDIPTDDFPNNPDPRLPSVLLLDTSYSMLGPAITQLNAGVRLYADELRADTLAARRVEIAMITFGGEVTLARDFATAPNFSPPNLDAGGNTPMAEAIVRGIKLLEDRKSVYRENGIGYYRPWIFLITDGAPTDGARQWDAARDAVRLGEQEKKFSFFAIGVDNADFTKLGELCPNRTPLRLKGHNFREFFKWLSSSQSATSRSQVGDNIQLPPPTGWGEIPT